MVGQMIYMIRRLVLDFEKQHGEIRSRNDLGYFVNCFHPLFVVISRRRGGENNEIRL